MSGESRVRRFLTVCKVVYLLPTPSCCLEIDILGGVGVCVWGGCFDALLPALN